jgi:hypothetical protein
MMWLITYSQRGVPGNAVIDVSPAEWLAWAVQKWPDLTTTLLFAMEVTEVDGKVLRELI